MKMMQRIQPLLFFCFLFVGIAVLAVPATAEEQGVHKPDVVGQEVKTVPESGGDVTKETTAGTTWDKTKKESKALMHTIGKKTKDAWTETKVVSKEIWEKGKAKIHKVTTPNPPAAPAKPITPPPTSPVVAPAKQPTPGTPVQ